MMKVNSYNCPECTKKFKTLNGWGEHLKSIHPGTIPEDYSYARYFYFTKTGKSHGNCITCKKPTDWNEQSMKYNRYCNNPECKKAYVKMAKQRMIDKYGKVHLLNDPEQQRKMLKGRRISGTYTFEDGVKFDYVGQYERNFLEMLNTLFNWDSEDLIAPSPHTYIYEDEEKHFYIPDFYIPSLNLEIEIKQQTSTNDAYNQANKPKEHMKDKIMSSNPKVNYLKINDNDFSSFFEFIMEYKERYITKDDDTKETKIEVAIESVIDNHPKMGIDNYVFDIGNVLVRNSFFEPIIRKYQVGVDDAKKYVEAYIDIEENANEQISIKEALQLFKDKLPDDLKGKSDSIFMDLLTSCNPYEYVDKLVKTLRLEKKKIYYLSNWSRHGFEALKESGKFDFLNQFDGGLVSYEIGIKKPSPDIYKAFLKRFDLDPSTCVFFDDRKENIDAAINAGMHGVIFNGDNGNIFSLLSKLTPAEEACKDINTARKFVHEVGKVAKKYDANYFIVTDGASGTHNKNEENDAIIHARKFHIEWEKSHGEDPNEDWIKDGSFKATESSIQIAKRWTVKGIDNDEHTVVNIVNDDTPYRARSEMLILKNDMLLINFMRGGGYSLPGGGWNFGEDPKDAAIRECQEEVRMNVKNVKYCGDRTWKYDSPAGWMIRTLHKEDMWKGCFCSMFIGEYDGEYTGYIKKSDLDDMANTAKFRKISEIYHILKPEHKKAIDEYFNSPFDTSSKVTKESSLYPGCECFGCCNRLNEEKSNCRECVHKNMEVSIESQLTKSDILSRLSDFHYNTDSFYIAKETATVMTGNREYSEELSIVGSPELSKRLSRKGCVLINSSYYIVNESMKCYIDEDFDLNKTKFIDGIRVEAATEAVKELNFKKASDLSKWMKTNIKYKEFDRLMDHDEVLKKKRGSCHDQVMFELVELRKMGYIADALFFIEHNDVESTYAQTHSLVIFKSDWNLYWFENAWGEMAGIHKIKSITDFVNALQEYHKEGKWGDYERYPMMEVAPFNFHDPGEELGEFVQKCLEFYINPDKMDEEFPALEEANYSEENSYPVFIVLQHSGTTLANIIKKFTNDEFSHACIAFNPELDPLYSFGNKKIDAIQPGFVIQEGGPKHPFYEKRKSYYSVYVMYVNKASYDAMQRRLKYFLNKKDELKYDFLNLFSVWIGRPSEKSKKYFCSRFVMEIIGNGRDLEKLPSLWKPQEISTLDDITLVNHGNDFRRYNKTITLKNMEKIKEGKFEEISMEKLENEVDNETIAMEGVLSFLTRVKNNIKDDTKSWKDILFESKDLTGKSSKKSSYCGIKLQDGKIIIYGINYKLLKNRISKYYIDKSIYNIFLPEYNAFDYRRFEKKKINRSQVRIEYLYTEEFFALELATMFTELGKRFRDRNYKAIAKQIYEESWLSKADKNAEVVSMLDTSNLKNLTLELNDYQKEFIMKYPKLKAQLNLNGYILAFEQGLGKTLTAISLSECLNADHVYIVCPNTLKANWALEIKKYYKKYSEDDDLWKSEVFLCSDKSIYFNENSTKFIITNNESIKKMMPYILRGKNMLILDESHNFRNVNSKRVSEMIALRDALKCTDTLVMSGTPIKATPSELVPALLLIDPTFTMDAALIFAKAFKLHSALGTTLVQERFGKVIYRKEKDVLEEKLPEKLMVPMSLQISNSDKYVLTNVYSLVMKRFEEIYDSGYDAFVKLKQPFKEYSRKYAPRSINIDRFLMIINIMVKKGKPELHEIDLMYVENGMKEIKENIRKKDARDRYDFLIKNYVRYRGHCLGVAFGEILPKYRRDMYIDIFSQNKDSIIDIIQNSVKKTIIFTQFKGVAEFINDSLNESDIGSVIITGDVKDRLSVLQDFKETPSILTLVATSQTLGTGVTLTEANQIIFFGPPWRQSDFDQCSDRIHRIGQTDTCYIYTISLDTGAEKNLSTRMDDILDWSREMTDAAISKTKEEKDLDQTNFEEVLTAQESSLINEFLCIENDKLNVEEEE